MAETVASSGLCRCHCLIELVLEHTQPYWVCVLQ